MSQIIQNFIPEKSTNVLGPHHSIIASAKQLN